MADARAHPPALTARAAGLVGCRTCGKASPAGVEICPRCHSALHSRMPAQPAAGLGAARRGGLICYIPANLYPMMITSSIGSTYRSTIVGGVIELFHHGAYAVAGHRASSPAS